LGKTPKRKEASAAVLVFWLEGESASDAVRVIAEDSGKR